MLLNLKNMLFLGDGGVYLLGIILSVSLIYEHNVKNNIIMQMKFFSYFCYLDLIWLD